MIARFLGVLGVLLSLVAPRAVLAFPLYAVDFDEQSPGPPLTGGPLRISEVVFGTPTVVESLGGFSQPLRFDNDAAPLPSYEQVRLDVDLAPADWVYQVVFDLNVLSLRLPLAHGEPHFAIFLDVPWALAIRLRGDGTIELQTFDPVLQEFELTHVGSYTLGTALHFAMTVDFGADTWTTELNGQPLFETPFEGQELDSIRFNLAGVTETDLAALDNIAVATLELPEPTLGWLTLAGLACATFRRAAAPPPPRSGMRAHRRPGRR